MGPRFDQRMRNPLRAVRPRISPTEEPSVVSAMLTVYRPLDDPLDQPSSTFQSKEATEKKRNPGLRRDLGSQIQRSHDQNLYEMYVRNR